MYTKSQTPGESRPRVLLPWGSREPPKTPPRAVGPPSNTLTRSWVRRGGGCSSPGPTAIDSEGNKSSASRLEGKGQGKAGPPLRAAGLPGEGMGLGGVGGRRRGGSSRKRRMH